jgi:hypothetical protein
MKKNCLSSFTSNAKIYICSCQVITLKAIESMVNYQPFKYYLLPCDTKPALSKKNGRVSNDRFILTPEQIECFHRNGCVTIPDVLREDEVDQLSDVFERFVSREIPVPGKDCAG